MTGTPDTPAMSRTGGCLCGQVRFVARGEPAMIGICHCKDCQRQTASAFAVIAVFDQGAVVVEGRLSSFTTVGESGRTVERFFCPACGSGVIGAAEFLPGKSLVRCGSFDETGWVRPTFSLYCDSAQPWQAVPETQADFPRMLASRA